MNINLKAKLQNAIDDWIQKSCESDEDIMPDIFLGDRLVEMMTNAAESVFDATVNLYEDLDRDGLLKK